MATNRTIKPVKDMAETLAAEKKNHKRMYKEMTDDHKKQELSELIARHAVTLAHSHERGKVNLKNIEEVKARTLEYLEACSLASSYPSVMGLAVHGLGMSREALERYLRTHDNHVTDYIKMVKDTFADILTNSSLYNNANPVQVIFQLKNHFGHVDRLEVQAQTEQPRNEEYDVEEIKRKYLKD